MARPIKTTTPSGESLLAREEFDEQSIPVSEGVTADAAIAPRAAKSATKPAETATEVTVDPFAPPSKEEIARIKAMRQPFGTLQQKLALPEIPGYKTHWFNDSPGRVEQAEASGWAFRAGKNGQPLKRVVGTGRDNGALYAFAMKLPLVFWAEDEARRDQAAARQLHEVKKKPFSAAAGTAKPSDQGKFYSPNEKDPVTISESYVKG